MLHNNIMLVCATAESGSLLPIEKIFSLLQVGATQNNVCNLIHACN